MRSSARNAVSCILLNGSNQLCFAINLAHVLDPNLTDGVSERVGRELQRRVGLDDHTTVTFTDVGKFERILGRKIIVYYRTGLDRPLCHFETNFPKAINPLFVFLQDSHYYGVKNIKGFVGTDFFCNYCYKGFNCSYVHTCKGYCQVCNDPACPAEKLRPLKCSDCNRTCR